MLSAGRHNLIERPGRRRAGLTMVEMLVAVAIISILVLGFSTVLSSSQQLVHGGQELIRANALAAAVTQVLREDLAGLNKDGFLAVKKEADGRCKLVFTSVGVHRSILDPGVVANAARIEWGLSADDAPFLYRRSILLVAGDASPGNDHINSSLAYYKKYPPDAAALELYGEPSLTLPPESLDQILALWPFVTDECAKFEVAYALSAAGGLSWTDAPSGTWQIWHSGNRDTWPAAIRVKVTLGTGATEREYELIHHLLK